MVSLAQPDYRSQEKEAGMRKVIVFVAVLALSVGTGIGVAGARPWAPGSIQAEVHPASLDQDGFWVAPVTLTWTEPPAGTIDHYEAGTCWKGRAVTCSWTTSPAYFFDGTTHEANVICRIRASRLRDGTFAHTRCRIRVKGKTMNIRGGWIKAKIDIDGEQIPMS